MIQNSPSAFNTSLDEVLAVFRQLHVNEGAQSIPPFWMNLSLQVKPSSYLAFLKQSAAVGQKLSDIIDLSGEEEPEEGYEDYQDVNEDPTLLGDGSGFENLDEGEVQADDHQPRAEPEHNEANHHHEYDTSHEHTEGGQEQNDRHDQYGQFDEVQQADFDTRQIEFETQQAVDEAQQVDFAAYEENEGQHANDAAEHVEESLEAQQLEDAEDTSYVVVDDVAIDPSHEVEPFAAPSPPAVTDNTTGDDRGDIGQAQDTEKASTIESAASSTTLQADQATDADNNDSEYKDEDLIDWNEITLTSRPSENNSDDANDFSNFLAENNIEESADLDPANQENQSTVEIENTNVVTDDGHEHATDGYDDTAGIDFGDDDFEHDAEGADQEGSAGAVDAVTKGEVQEQTKTQASTNGVADPEPRVAPETKEPQSEVVSSKEPVRNEEDYIDFDDEDGIDFDDDTFEEHEARKASEANTPGSKSPPGKRPLDDGGDEEQPELKKVKSS